MNLNEHIQEVISVLEGAMSVDGTLDKLTEVVDILRNAKESGNTVYTFGNGGSHSTASHFACDLLKACGIRAICISDMVPSAYAYMNDDGIKVMFDEILSNLMESGDVMIAFSCSGNSENVRGAVYNSPFLHSILFTGDDGGIAAGRAQVVIKVYNDNIRIQESAHLAYCHAIVEELLDEAV
jgi:D-sedoheptulose 7-phosphate isomerase